MFSSGSVLQPFNAFYVSYKELKTVIKTDGKTDDKVKAAALKVFVTGFYLVSSAAFTATSIGIIAYCPYGFAASFFIFVAVGYKNETIIKASACFASAASIALLAAQILVIPPLGLAVFGIGSIAYHLYFGKQYNQVLEEQIEQLNKNGVSNPCFYSQTLQDELTEIIAGWTKFDFKGERTKYGNLEETKKLKRVNEEGYLISHVYSPKIIDKIINFVS